MGGKMPKEYWRLRRRKIYKQFRARERARAAIKSGKLIKLPCEICGELKVDAHHDNYDYPLNVRFLCRKHHIEYHKKDKIK